MRVLCLVLFLVSANIHLFAQVQSENITDSMKFKITIINYYFGRVNNQTVVTEDSLIYEIKIYRGNSKKNPDYYQKQKGEN